MHDIWNPWHGCTKASDGCKHCYMMYLDKLHNTGDGTKVYKTNSFNYPLSKLRDGTYRVKSGEMIRVCMNSDFYLDKADAWREEAFQIMKKRSDVIFYLLTKRPERVLANTNKEFLELDNIFFNVTIESGKYAIDRLEELARIPFKHKGIMVAPFIGEVKLGDYIKKANIEQVICAGENYGGDRPCEFDWVLALREECVKANVKFAFTETGTYFIKDKKEYILKKKVLQAKMAYKSQTYFEGKPIDFVLRDVFGNVIPKEKLFQKQFTSINCSECGSKYICNGCSNCGKCIQIKQSK